ncbi:hypothetical protein CDAR_517661 [Caerostris darwini]|uniref:Uncharacterized protein n=1 Tax=Caerostris darwini TaxID=1538125 RepID=A0AAV4PLP4_9ARAC|nr:hypothetical protein CDAR_517661 [Caerostris darwini]
MIENDQRLCRSLLKTSVTSVEGRLTMNSARAKIVDSVKHDMKMKLDIQGYNITASFKGRPTSKGHGLCPVGYGGRDSMANIVLPSTFNCTVNNFFCQIQLHKSDQN